MNDLVLGILIVSGALILFFVFIRPFLRGYNEGMSEREKTENINIPRIRLVKSIGVKRIIFVSTLIFGIGWIYVSNQNDINRNTHTVNQSNGSSYERTNRNSTTDDNIGENRSDTFWGVLFLISACIVVYRIFIKN